MIRIICLGKIKENYLKDLINDYTKRIQKYHKLEIIELKDYENISKETSEILNNLNSNSYNIALTIDGDSYDSISFSQHVDNIFQKNGMITFVIGASNGLSDEVINKCHEKISFSKFTFPHGLFRGILLEQLYRAFKIINNETYHK